VTARLLGMLRENWTVIEGEREWVSPGAPDLLELPIDRLLNLTYYWGTRNGDEAEVRKFDARLWVPPKGVAPTEGPWSPEAETNAFRAFAKQVRGDAPVEGPGAGSGQPRQPGVPVRAPVVSPGSRRSRSPS